jgi:DNA-binding transcriptional MocR family regulator
MALIEISNNSKLSLVEQIVDKLKQLIDSNVIREGTRATSIRVFAKQHKISPHTVAESYERLVALGYLESRPRSGFFVAKPKAFSGNIAHGEIFSRAFDHLWQIHSQLLDQEGTLNVSSGKLPNEWVDSTLIKVSLKSIAAKIDSGLVQYGDPYGYRPLRGLLQTKLGGLGIHSQSDQILLTIGASQAIDLIIRYLLRPGDKVLVDDPGYFNLFSNLQMSGIEPVPVTRELDGPDLDLVEKLAKRHRPALMFTQSVLHTPTGSTISPAKAHRLLRLAEQYDFRIVENDAYADMLGAQMPRIATLDQLSRVLYVGSFSKTLSASVRVGFVAGQANLIRDLANMKMITSVTSSQLDEKLVFHSLTEGHYRRNVERLRDRLGVHMQQTCDMLETYGFQVFCRPLGGKFVWVRHPAIEDSEQIWRSAAVSNIIIAPGKVFRFGLDSTPWFRINIAYGGEPTLLKFLKTVG